MSKLENKRVCDEDEQFDEELRKGPWTIEEDTLLSNYINFHGEGRWNLLAKSSGLKRSGKSCRLRWLNYLKPDIKRGNLSSKEQILILELHSKWGNRWSKIAQHLPGRTDNEIKNYWRTRVQKQARQLKVDSNSKKFLEALRQFWMPRLLEKSTSSSISSTSTQDSPTLSPLVSMPLQLNTKLAIENQSSSICSSDSMNMPNLFNNSLLPNDCYHVDIEGFSSPGPDISADEISISDCQMAEIDWSTAADINWDLDELWEIKK